MSVRSHKLVIVESPAKARTIGKYLGKNYKVIASQGHVRDLPKSQLGVDPEHDFDMKYITIRGRGEILSEIRKEAKNASCIYLATDPDREGEAISWHLSKILDIDEDSACRIEFNEVTKKAVQAAIKSPRKLDMDRIDAQQARRALDRLVGYKISPLLWTKVKKGLSAGRVQSVATRMVVMREKEIDAFIPEEYWDIAAHCTAQKGHIVFDARLNTCNGEKLQISDSASAEKTVMELRKEHFTVTSVRTGDKSKLPAAPFTTSSMQQEAGRKLNFTVAKTMQVVQQLYEGIDLENEGTQGLVTYIRTDSVRVSEDAIREVRAFIGKKYGESGLPDEPNIYKGRKNAQDAHEAIRPTSIERTPESIKGSLTREQFQLYKLIYNRFLASQMKPAMFRTMNVEISGEKYGLHFYGEQKVYPGFTAIYEESRDEEDSTFEKPLPGLSEGITVSISDIDSTQHFTQPPARYTEASLVHTLEENGIGRPSTYAPTITTIVSRGYVSREKKRLYPTEMGKMITGMMEEYFPGIVDIDFTADLENKLDDVENGSAEWKQLLRDFYPSFIKMLSKAESTIEKVEVTDEISDVICDKCGKYMVYRMGRFGKFLACPNFPECRNTKAIINYIEACCPKCGSRLLEKTSKKNRRFYGCEKFPECDFVSWEKPVTDKCPACGSYMVEKKNAKGDLFHICSCETCRKKIEVSEENTDEEDK